MRRVLGQAAIAAVLFGLGFIAWNAGQLQNRVADAHEELAMLRYNAADAEYGDIEDSMGYVSRVPWVGDALLSDVRGDRATGDYWQARYDALAPKRDATGAAVEQPPNELALAANAGFRTTQRDGGDRQATLKRLDAAIKAYTEVLKKSPGDADAAYNFEYIVRLRDTLSKAKPAPAGKREDPAKVIQRLTGVQMAGDLPEGRTVHGDPGAPPPNTDMTQFKMHIPVRPDERQGGSDAGQGKEKIRKG
jgi:tetratricopeptide (TPR) repeat protein